MDTVFGLTADRLVVLAGLGVLLLVGLLVLKFALKLSTSFIKLGCLGILVIMLIACVVMLALPG